MEQEWRALAETVPPTMSDVYESATEARKYIALACAELHVRSYDIGGMANDITAPDPLQVATNFNPSLKIQSAFRKIVSHNEHGRAVRVFSLYGEHLGLLHATPLWEDNNGLLQGDMMWQSWAQTRDQALRRTGQVPRRLCSALSYDLATRDALAMVRRHSRDSPSRNAWMLAAGQLALRTQEEASMALDEEDMTRNAVQIECLDASAIVKS